MKLKFKALLTAALFVTLGGLAQAASSEDESNAAMLEAAKSVAAEAVGQDRSSQTDAQGNLECQDTQGNTVDCKQKGAKPKSQKTSESSQEDDLRAFKNMTGLQNVEMTATPTDANQVGMANVNTENSFDFSCRLARPNAIFNAGNLSFRFVNCAMSGSGSAVNVSGAQFYVCDNPTRSDVCATNEDYGIPANLQNGKWTNTSAGSIGMNCNNTGQCRVTARKTSTVGGSDASMREGAEEANQNSSVAKNWREQSQSEAYKTEMAAQQQQLADCAGTGDGSGKCEVNKGIQEGAPTSNCSDVSTCLRYAVTKSEFQRSCDRAFAVTERTVTRSYNAVAECEVVESTDPSVPSSNSCPSGPPAGYTQVGQTAVTCDEGTVPPPSDTNGDGVIDDKDTPPTAPECAVKRYTSYFVDLSQVTETAPSYGPYPVKGGTDASCDLRPNSSTRFHSCQQWFGRTEAACTVYFTDDSGASTQGEGGEVDFSQKQGCGFCVKQDISATCYAEEEALAEKNAAVDQADDTCAKMDLEGCFPISATPSKYTSDGGLVVAQRETYYCKKESRQCVEWSATGTDPSCTRTEAAKGTDSLAEYRSSSGDSLTRAIQASAQMESVARGQEGGSTATKPGVYNGRDMRCRRPVGEVNERFTPNCCASDLMRPPEGTTSSDGCTIAEAELAAARRSGYAHFVGQYCSRRFNSSVDSTEDEPSVNTGDRCIRQTETYCVFDSVLARMVHEQGRPQLAGLASSSAGATAQSTSLSFGYLAPEPAEGARPGGWTTPVSVNGVSVAAYRWPHYCATTRGAMEALASGRDAPDCPPVVSTWFAACDLPGGCGELPVDPSDGDLRWRITSVDPLTNKSTAVSTLAVVSGACSPTTMNCSYEVTSWPAGKGGRATVTRDLRWPLFGPQPTNTNEASSAVKTTNGVGDMIFQGYPAAGAASSALPNTVRLDLSRDGGATWKSFYVATNKPDARQPLVDDIEVMGGCSLESNYCEFRAVGTVAVAAKPWGTAIQPDCSGFTAGQLAALDFSKMDLDEWTADVMKANGESVDSQGIAARAPVEAKAAEQRYQAGVVLDRSASSSNFARVVPAEGFGPFTAKLQVSGYWPGVTGDPAQDNNKVLSATVNWGDCSPSEPLAPVSDGVGFQGTHLYQAPNHQGAGGYVHACLGGSMERNLTHKVKVTVSTSKTGTQSVEMDVINVWARFDGNEGKNSANVGTTLQAKPYGK